MLKGKRGAVAAMLTLLTLPALGADDSASQRNPALPSQGDLISFEETPSILPTVVDATGALQGAFPINYGEAPASPQANGMYATGVTTQGVNGAVTQTYVSVPEPVMDDAAAFRKAGYLDYESYKAKKLSEQLAAAGPVPSTETSVASVMPHAGNGFESAPPTLGARVEQPIIVPIQPAPQPVAAATATLSVRPPLPEIEPTAEMIAPREEMPNDVAAVQPVQPEPQPERPVETAQAEPIPQEPEPQIEQPASQPDVDSQLAETHAPRAVESEPEPVEVAAQPAPEPLPEPEPPAVAAVTEPTPQPASQPFTDEQLESHFPMTAIVPPPLPGYPAPPATPDTYPTVGLAEFKTGTALDGTPLPPPPPVPELPGRPAEVAVPRADPAQVRADFNRLKAYCEEDSLGSAAEIYTRMPDFSNDEEINRLRADAANLLILGLARNDNLAAARRIYNSVPTDMPGFDATLAKTRGVINLATYYVRAERYSDAYDILLDLERIDNRSSLNNELFRLMARMIPYLDNADETDKATRVYDMLLNEVKSPGTASLFADNVPGVLKYFLHYVDKSENPLARRKRMDFLEHMFFSMDSLKDNPEIRMVRGTVGMSLADRYAGDPDRAARFMEN